MLKKRAAYPKSGARIVGRLLTRAGQTPLKVDARSICGAGTRTDLWMTLFFGMDTVNNGHDSAAIAWLAD